MPTLHWIGKEKVINHHMDVPYRVLEHQYGYTDGKQDKKETNSGNKIIHGDNLEALKALLPEYEGRIDCIYIDPPYNTGNEKWVYNDNVNDPKIKKWLNEVVGKEGEDLSRHDKWLCMMYPRLKLLHKLLADNGVLFVSIDDNEYSNFNLICGEIFGYTNSIGPIIQNKMNAKNDTVNIQKNHEFIVVYRKKELIIEGTKVNPTILHEKVVVKQVFKEGDEYYFINDSITTRGEGGVLSARPNLGYTIYYNAETNDKIAVVDYDLELAKTAKTEDEIYSTDKILLSKGYEPIRPPKVRGKLGCWTWSLDKFNDNKKEIIITGKKGAYAVKKRTFINSNEVSEEDGRFFVHVLSRGNSRSIINFSTNEGTNELNNIMGETSIFDNPKNVQMLEYLINLCPNKNAVVLDSFAGSGSTAQAILSLNKKDNGSRKFICIEMMDYADTITAERVKKVINGYSYIGNKKEIIASYPVNLSTLKKSNKIIDQFSIAKESGKYKEVKIEPSKESILITGTIEISESVDSLSGSFDYYELGPTMFDAEQNLNEELPVEKIRAYVYYTETKQHLEMKKHKDNPYLMDVYNDTGYYFYYKKEQLTVLDNAYLATIKTKVGQYLIYADVCLLSSDFMLNKNIIFKKIPRDITRF